MSGETEATPSSWTIDSLNSHWEQLMAERSRHVEQSIRYLERTLAEHDTRYEQRFQAQQLALKDALTAQQENHRAALASADRAIQTAQAANEKRFDATNEFRATLADAQATLMPRGEAEQRMSALNDKLTELGSLTRDADDRLREQHARDMATSRDEFNKALATLNQTQDRSTGRDHGISLSWVVGLGALGALLTVTGLVLTLIKLN